MTLSELRSMLLRTVKRAELTTQALDAINAAIEFASSYADWSFDLQEGTESIDATAYAQSLTISSVFPRYRKMKYLRPTGYVKYLDRVDPAKVFDKNGCERINVWYRAGASIVFKLSVLQSSMEYGYYAYPTPFTTASANSSSNYFTELMGAAIHDLAAGRMFEDMGNEAEATRLQARGIRLLTQHARDKADG